MQKVVEEMHSKMATKAANILQWMEQQNFKKAARDSVSEAFSYAFKCFIGECEVLSPEVCQFCARGHVLASVWSYPWRSQ